MRLKVRGGTAQFGQASLCYSCKWSTIVRGEALNQEIVECSQISTGYQGLNRIRFKVTECGEYLHKNSQSVREMQEIAWILKTDEKKQIGFVPFKEIAQKERAEFSAPDPEDYD